MSSYAVLDSEGTLTGADEATKRIRDAINDAKEDRKRYEPTWQSNLAFAAGKFWMKWDRDQRRLVTPDDYYEREHYSADVITEYRMTALGEMGSDDDRPELLLRQDDQFSEEFQEQLNRAVAFGWDYEWMGDEVLEDVRRIVLDLGTAGCQVKFDPTVGPTLHENVPYSNGRPVLDMAKAAQLMGGGPNSNIEMRPMQTGRISWVPLSPFNLIVPTGIPNERDFPWEAVVRPVLLSSAKDEYGAALGDIREDTDISSIMGLDAISETADTTSTLGTLAPDGKASRLRNHIWLTTYYERPSRKFPKGRMIVFAGNRMKPVRIINELPYCKPDGTYCSGIAYFHWWRVTGRFWSRGLIEAMKDPQRSVNKRRTQINEIIDRGMPAIFLEKNSKAKDRKGIPNELIEIGTQERQPAVFNGVSPGEWMYHDIQEARVDLEHATGIRGPRLGENPENVTTYAQLALLNENDQVKRQMILREHKLSIAKLVEYSVHDIRTYWGAEKQISLVSEDDRIEADLFNATRVPTFFVVKVAKGAAKPRSEAAELKKIEELWQAALASGAVVNDPQSWVEWLDESLAAGQARDLPTVGNTVHEDHAQLENWNLEQGEPVYVMYFDPLETHIPIHRAAQLQAVDRGDLELWQRIEDHVQAHLLTHMQSEMALAGMTAGMGAPPLLGGMPMPGAEGPAAAMAAAEQGAAPGGAGGITVPAMGDGGIVTQPTLALIGEKGPEAVIPLSGGGAGQGAGQSPMNIEVPVSIQVPPLQMGKAPVVNVAPSPAPNVNVSVPEAKVQERDVTFERDEHGRIIGATVTDKKPKRGG